MLASREAPPSKWQFLKIQSLSRTLLYHCLQLFCLVCFKSCNLSEYWWWIHFSDPLTCFASSFFFSSLQFTRMMQEVHIAKNVKLIDSPGVVASPSNPPASMALRSLQVEEGGESVLEAVRNLLKQCDKTQVRRVSLTGSVNHYKFGRCCKLHCFNKLRLFVLIVPDHASV